MKKNVKKSFGNFWNKIVVFFYLKLAKPASFYCRKIFEFKKINQALGFLILFFSFLAGTLPVTLTSVRTLFDTNSIRLRPAAVELTTQKSLQKPLGIFKITKGYSFFHPATDFATEAGSAVLAILPGMVEKVSFGRFGYGNYVVVNHGSGLKSLYAHLVKINVKEKQLLDKETILGFVGSSGWSSGPHLHLEIWEDSRKINPQAYFEAYFGEKLASLR